MAYNRDKIIKTLREIVDESKEIKPYVVIAQPRRDLDEKPAQNFNGYEGIHVDLCGFSHGFIDIGGEMVDVARNYLIEEVIESGCKYLLFIGEDTVIPFDGFNKLHEIAEANPDAMVVGVYYIKLSVPMIMIRQGDYIVPANVDPGQVYEAWQTGLDCALIPVSILKAMKDEEPEIPFCCIAKDVEDMPFVGEDNFFVYRLRKMGYKLLVNTDVQCLHIDLLSGKYTAHPSVNLDNYFTNIPITTPLTMEDKKYIDMRWTERLPKRQHETLQKIYNMIENNLPIKLNLGSGGIDYEGYISIDKYDKSAEIMVDVCELDLPENSVDEILASHLIEHINPYIVDDVLKQWLKILKPDCKLIMELPDIEGLCKDFMESDIERRKMLIRCIYGSLNTTAYGNNADITSPHLWGYYSETIKETLEAAGFVDIQIMEEKIKHPTSNFRVEARKSKGDTK